MRNDESKTGEEEAIVILRDSDTYRIDGEKVLAGAVVYSGSIRRGTGPVACVDGRKVPAACAGRCSYEPRGPRSVS